jgi:hypothetical protein
VSQWEPEVAANLGFDDIEPTVLPSTVDEQLVEAGESTR